MANVEGVLDLQFATKMAELNIALQQMTAKYNIIKRALGPVTSKMLRIWAKNVEDYIPNSQQFAMLSVFLNAFATSMELIEKYELECAAVAEKVKQEYLRNAS